MSKNEKFRYAENLSTKKYFLSGLGQWQGNRPNKPQLKKDQNDYKYLLENMY